MKKLAEAWLKLYVVDMDLLSICARRCLAKRRSKVTLK
jgi:hypothetical protein